MQSELVLSPRLVQFHWIHCSRRWCMSDSITFGRTMKLCHVHTYPLAHRCPHRNMNGKSLVCHKLKRNRYMQVR